MVWEEATLLSGGEPGVLEAGRAWTKAWRHLCRCHGAGTDQGPGRASMRSDAVNLCASHPILTDVSRSAKGFHTHDLACSLCQSSDGSGVRSPLIPFYLGHQGTQTLN